MEIFSKKCKKKKKKTRKRIPFLLLVRPLISALPSWDVKYNWKEYEIEVKENSREMNII